MASDSFTPVGGSGPINLTVYNTGNVEVDDSTDINVRHIPGGNTSYIDIGGILAPTTTTELFFATSAAYNTFRAQIGKVGVLSLFQGGQNTPEVYQVVLKDLKRTFISLTLNGETRATATWQVMQ